MITDGGGNNASPIIFISFFNEIKCLPKVIPAIRRHIPRAKIIAVDGAFKDFPYEKPYSTDGSVEYLMHKKVKVIRGGAWATEAEKRNKFFEFLRQDDLWIYLDADEVITAYKKDLFDSHFSRYKCGKTIRKIRRCWRFGNEEFITHWLMVNHQKRLIYSLGFLNNDEKEVCLELESLRREKNEKMSAFKKIQTPYERLIEKEFRKKGYRNAY